MNFIKIKAPFAVFRPLMTGKFRLTYDYPSPSAMRGLILNLASYELHEKHDPFEFAIGINKSGKKNSILTQIHRCPTDMSLKGRVIYGRKPSISLSQREFLSEVEYYIALKTSDSFLERINSTLEGKLERTGIPFLGDNNFFLEEILVQKEIPEVNWMVKFDGQLKEINSLPSCYDLIVNWNDYSCSERILLSVTKSKLRDVPSEAWLT